MDYVVHIPYINNKLSETTNTIMMSATLHGAELSRI